MELVNWLKRPFEEEIKEVVGMMEGDKAPGLNSDLQI